jgi:hypothetical protein
MMRIRDSNSYESANRPLSAMGAIWTGDHSVADDQMITFRMELPFGKPAGSHDQRRSPEMRRRLAGLGLPAVGIRPTLWAAELKLSAFGL